MFCFWLLHSSRNGRLACLDCSSVCHGLVFELERSKTSHVLELGHWERIRTFK